jgi:predicted RND superfamily exporter protein
LYDRIEWAADHLVSRIFNRTADAIVDHPWLVVALILAVSGLAIVGYVAPELVTGLFSAEPAAAPDEVPASSAPVGEAPAPPDVDPVRLSDADAVLVVHSPSDQFFTSRGARALRHVVEELDARDHIQSVLWMDRVPVLNIFGLNEPLLPRGHASERRFAAARERAVAHPLVGGQLLSSDGRTLLLLITFDWLFIEADDDCISGLRQIAEQAASAYPDVELTFQVTGRVPIFLTVMKAHDENQLKYQIIGYGMVALMALVLFRGLRAVVIVSLAPSVGVFWSLGMLRFFEFHANPFNDVVLPVLLSLVGLTDGVHLMVEIRRRSAAGLPPREAARAAVRQVGLACVLTALTTAVGFGSLSLAQHEIVREFGWSCVIGVVLTFLAVILVIPLACCTPLGRRVHVGHEKGLIDRNLNRVGGVIEFVLARPRAFSRLAIAATLLLTLVALTLRPDERLANVMPEDAEAAVAFRQMDEAFGGLEMSSVDVMWTGAVPSDSPEVLVVISEVDELLGSEELIGHPLSIVNFLDALPGEGPPGERMSLLELLPPPLKRAFYTPEHRTALISFRVQDLGIARYGPVFERVQAGLDRIAAEHPAFTLRLSGDAVWRWQNLHQIVVDLGASLGSESIIILLVLTLAFRSIRIGLISIVPNLFPLGVTAAYLVATGQPLEIVSVCAFTVSLGIAVDDTIHFLTRFQEERPHTTDDAEAIRRAFTGAGTGMLMTTVVLVAGFATVAFSGMRDQRIFATMGGLTLIAALFGDLILLPGLLLRFAPPRSSGDAPQESPGGQ